MSFVEIVLVSVFVVPICVLVCCFFIAATYIQVKDRQSSPKESKALTFNTLSRHDMRTSTARLLKQDRKRRSKIG